MGSKNTRITAPVWTESDIARLRMLAADGLTYAQIAQHLGRTRASVQIKCGRLGLSNNRPAGGRKGNPGHLASHRGDRAMEVGTAAELLVCADLLLAGHKAFLSSQGLPYDVVAEFGDRLLRVAVKGSQRAAARPEREGGRVCYQFRLMRSGAHKTHPNRRYMTDHCDLIALVALDLRRVIYVAPTGNTWPTAFHVDPPGIRMPSSHGPDTRKKWDDFSLYALKIRLGMCDVAAKF